MSDSFVRRFLFEHLDIRGAIVHLGDSWQQMQVDRDYQPTVAQLLGETAARQLIAACGDGATAAITAEHYLASLPAAE